MVLIVDDDPSIRSSIKFLLKRKGYEVEEAEKPEKAMDFIRKVSPSVVLLDMNFSLSTTGEEGVTLLKQIKLFRKEVPVILMTAWGNIELAVKGMKAGAFDFITKPWNNTVLLQRIETAIELKKEENNKEQEDNFPSLSSRFINPGIIGKSRDLKIILHTLERIAKTNAPVLITGESGTGKEMIAEAIHLNSKRAKNPFVKVNLGGISQSLFESEMFGHKKGSFTGATSDRAGRFETADKGTIFLDEIAELDLSCQVKLLRVLQDQTYEALGDSKPRKTDVRIVSATNENLLEMVKAKTFREDLFYRINLITLHLPSLRERKEDIPLLAEYFAKKICEQNGLDYLVGFSTDALAFLQSLPYSGNIRELKNLVERTILVTGKKEIGRNEIASQYVDKKEEIIKEGMTLDEMEMQMIRHNLKKYDNNISKVASSLGLSRAALYRRLEKYGIDIFEK